MNAEALERGPSAHLTGHYIITLHAIELGLKAYLAKMGLTERELSRHPYGHDLVALYTEATNRGLTLPIPGIEQTLQHLNIYHSRGAILRYNFSDARQLPLCSSLYPIIAGLVTASQ